MSFARHFLLFCICSIPILLKGQSSFYQIDSVREVRIYFEEANWDELLDTLYARGNGERLVGDVQIDGTLLKDVGIRYKGYSSASTERVKNPFNIDLDYLIEDQEYQGYDKLKLSNVIHDPSFLREVLAYEIAGDYMPVSKANFANVYVNDMRMGLYTNVEAVDKGFLYDRFGSKYQPFFKGNPETIDLNGENSNLSNSPGDDFLDYLPFYTLKSEDPNDWQHLYDFINVLNEQPEDLETVLNIDRALWMHAFNYAVVNFDSYIGYAQNYYIYQAENGQYQPILWDMNQSFASYRLTDASIYWQGFSISEAPYMDPLSHYSSVSVYPRPFMRQLFNNDTHRRMFLAHLRTIMEEHFSGDEFETRAKELHDHIATHVLADENKFYGDDDFKTNIDTTVQDLIEYPGLVSLMKERSTYLKNYPGMAGAPELKVIAQSPSTHLTGNSIWINAQASGATNVVLAYRFSKSAVFKSITMQDDGKHEDGAANDGVFGGQIPQAGNLVQYYLYAENDSAGSFSPSRAAHEFYTISASLNAGSVVINEFMASNRFAFADEKGQYDDWVELYNTLDYPISTTGLFLSNETSLGNAWALPDRMIPAKGYLVIWLDDDVGQGDKHADFKLKSEEGYLALFNANQEVFDEQQYGEQDFVVSYGRYPNGTGDFDFMVPSPKEMNSSHNQLYLEQSLFLYPNPAHNQLNIEYKRDTSYILKIISPDSRVVTEIEATSSGTYTLSTADYQPGYYFVRAVGSDFYETQSLIIIHD